jgi:hypothetical protein
MVWSPTRLITCSEEESRLHRALMTKEVPYLFNPARMSRIRSTVSFTFWVMPA